MENSEKYDWQLELKAWDIRKEEIIKKYDLKYGWFLEGNGYIIQNNLISKYGFTKETAEDAVYEAILVYLSNIFDKKDIQFNEDRNIFNYIYTIALRKAFELKNRILKIENIENTDEIIYTPSYLDQPTGNTFRDIYDGKKDIDEFLKKESEGLKLLELRIIQNLSYDEILALEEYSHYNAATLRKKVQRSFDKYKNFLNE